MESKPAISKKKKLFFSIVTTLLIIIIFLVCYVSYVAFATAKIYQSIKTNQRGWKGNVHTADAELGFAPIPNSEGAHVFPIGPDIPMRYDKDGFRTPMVVGVSSRPKPLILALGCSFTYGDAIHAEDAYPYLVGQFLNGTSKNAGVCSYGLSQMLIIARKLVPIHKPDYLLVQYSPWLVERAQTPFTPSYFGKVPVPFFYEKDNGVGLYPPVFSTKTMALPVNRYRNSPASLMDALSFYWNVGLPLSVYDDFNMLKYAFFTRMGIVPSPAASKDKLTKYVYGEINDVAKKHGTKVVIVSLGDVSTPVVQADRSLFPPDALLVNTHDALLERLPVANFETYVGAYAHWRGLPPVMVDSHPNEDAHRIIADVVANKIRQSEKK